MVGEWHQIRSARAMVDLLAVVRRILCTESSLCRLYRRYAEGIGVREAGDEGEVVEEVRLSLRQIQSAWTMVNWWRSTEVIPIACWSEEG